MFAREGYPFILGAAALAAIGFTMALRLRSWPLWLAAIVLTVIALSVAWFFRNPTRVGERGASVATAPVDGEIVMRQIAGLVARRISTDSKSGDAPQHGSRMGLIRFGSGVHLVVPRAAKRRVMLGQRTRAGEMVIADLPVS
ncbi:MAG: phosphatidylserine decarboxylase [Gemmatimonas sp.]